MAPSQDIRTNERGSEIGIRPADAASQFVDAGGLRLHYLDYGTAGRPPMLCVHGGAAHAHWFDFIAPDFRTDFHVRSLDLRGHGESTWSDATEYSCERMASDLAEVVEKLDLRDFVLIGHSMGGTVALMYAATYPGRVSKLVVAEARPRMSDESVASLRAFSARPSKTYATPEEFVAGFSLRPGGTHVTAPQILRHIAQRSIRQTTGGRWIPKFDRRIHAHRDAMDGLAYWSKVSIPALFIRGGVSKFISAELADAVKLRCPHVDVAVVANSGHHVPLDNPAGFTQAVKTFLGKHV